MDEPAARVSPRLRVLCVGTALGPSLLLVVLFTTILPGPDLAIVWLFEVVVVGLVFLGSWVAAFAVARRLTPPRWARDQFSRSGLRTRPVGLA